MFVAACRWNSIWDIPDDDTLVMVLISFGFWLGLEFLLLPLQIDLFVGNLLFPKAFGPLYHLPSCGVVVATQNFGNMEQTRSNLFLFLALRGVRANQKGRSDWGVNLDPKGARTAIFGRRL
jgi:hypothetical protein